jgi:hypothetical protein
MAVEEPAYTLVLQEGEFEVRDYPALVAAEVTVNGNRTEAANSGFRLLAGYIFGGNTRRQSIPKIAPLVQEKVVGESIAMTAPVIQTQLSGAWLIRFIMPRDYLLETLPVPNESRIHLTELAPARVAVLRFSGLAYAADIAQKTRDLMAFNASHGFQAMGPASLARYNPPWTLWFMQRNEIMIPLISAR